MHSTVRRKEQLSVSEDQLAEQILELQRQCCNQLAGKFGIINTRTKWNKLLGVMSVSKSSIPQHKHRGQ